MNYVKIFKALSNETRLNILRWLKEPEEYFAGHCLEDSNFHKGVCVGIIKEKAGLSQSTISEYLSMLEQAGLLECRRVGQWTYFRRNEAFIKELYERMGKEL